MASSRIETLLVLGASGDLVQRLLLPGLGSLLASDWQPDRPAPLVLGSGLEELGADRWRARVRESFGSAGARRRLTDAVRRTRYLPADVTDSGALAALVAECEGTPAIYFALPPAVTARTCAALAH